jgi:hypothetical protein
MIKITISGDLTSVYYRVLGLVYGQGTRRKFQEQLVIKMDVRSVLDGMISLRNLLLLQSFRCIIYGYLRLVLGYEQSPEFNITERI